MSGFSSETICPNCNMSADSYTDYKPFDYTSIFCPYCGLSINPYVTYYDLDELNEHRQNNTDLRPLKKLPKQEFQY